MTTLIIGDSHGIFLARSLGSVRKGVWDEALAAPLPVVGDDGAPMAEFILLNGKARFFQRDAQGVQVAPPHAGTLAAHDGPGTLCLISLRGNDHNGRFMLRHDMPFDFVCPHVPEQLALGRQFLPRDVVLRELRSSAALVAQELSAIQQKMPRAQLAFVLPPPPIPDIDHIRSNPEAFDLSRFEIEDKWVRLKIYHAYMDVLREVCQTLGVPLLAPPAAALDKDGFLAAPHWQGATHAAPSYYRLLLQPQTSSTATPTRTNRAPVQATA